MKMYTEQEIHGALMRAWELMGRAYRPSAAGAIISVAGQLGLEETFKKATTPPDIQSWADAIFAAKTPEDRAKVYLDRALQRESKQLIAWDITTALGILHPTETHTAETALQWYSLPYTQAALHQLAENLLKHITE